jgi:hypothetical protein
MLQFVTRHLPRYLCKYWQQVSLHQIGLCHAASYIPPIEFVFEKLEPSFEVLQTCKRIVSKRVCAIVSSTTNLKKREQCFLRPDGMTYG